MGRLAILALLLAAAQQAGAQAPPATCEAPEHHQFDFWVGHWRVTVPSGKPASDSRIESILDGCGISETFTAWNGAKSRSLNLYDRTTGQWEQFWIDNQGNRLQLRGGLRNGAMVMETPAPEAGGSTRRDRITWTPNADGSVRQLWETSTDSGATWSVSWDGLYTRREE